MFSANSNQSGGVVDATTDPYFNSTTLLLSGDGTNGAQNNTFVDSSVNNATITRTGTTTQGSFSPFSQTGWSTYFNGSSSNLQIASNAALALGTGDFTIEMWVYNTSSTNRLLSYGTVNSPILYINGSNFVQYDNYGSASLQTSSIAVPLSAWSHIAVVRLASNTKIYINGAQASTGADSTNWLQAGFYIGVDISTTFMTGYLSNLRVVKGVAVYTGAFTPPTAPLSRTQSAGTNIVALSGTETNLLTLQDNRFKDNSTNNFAITAVGTPSVQAFSPFAPTAAYSQPAAAAGSAYFNGTNACRLTTIATSGFDFGSANFTIEFWAYFNTNTATMQFNVGNSGLLYIRRNTNTTMTFFVYSYDVYYDNNYYNSGTSTLLVPISVWNHIALVSVNSVYKLYVNGILYASVTGTVGAATDGRDYSVGIGGYYDASTGQTNGYMSNVRVVKGIAVYTGAFTPPSAPLSKIQSAGTNIAPLSGTETVLLTLQDSTFKDNSNTHTITAYGAPVIQSFTPFTQVWGGYFDGSGYSTLVLPSNASLAMGTGNFTIEFWINTSNIAQTGYVLQTDTGANTLYISISGSTIRLTNQSTVFAVTPTLLSNTWYHIAVVRSGTSSVIYTNGVAGTAVTCSIDFTQAGPTIGGNSFIGYISNFRFVKGTAVYTGNFTPPAKTLSATQAAGTNISAIYPGQTSLLTLQDPTFKDNAILPNTITATGTPKTQLVSAPFTSAATVDPINGAAYFNGSSYISVPDSTAFTMGAGDFTLEAWVYLTTSGTSRMIFGTCNAAGSQGSMSFVLGVNASNNAIFAIGYAGAMYTSTNTATVPTNQWVHIAGVRNGGGIYAYLNGVQSTSNTNMGALAITDSTQVVAIGRNGAYNGEYVTGYISNVRIVKGTAVYTAAFQPPTAPLTAITNTSLLILQDTTFKDNSINAAVITAAGTPAICAFTPFASNWGGYFDGSSQLICANNAAFAFFTSNFTVECWLYPLSSGGQSVMNYSNGQSASTNWAWEMYQNNGTTIQFAVYDSDGASGYVASSTGLRINTWNHIAVVRNGNTMSIYVNGIVGGTTASVTGVSVFNKSAATLKISGYNNATYQYTGYVSNARIVNGTAVYTTNFQPPSAPLTAITNTSLLTLQNNTFIDNSTNTATITPSGAPKTQLLQVPFTSPITKVSAPWNISVTEPLATVGGSMYFDGSSGEGGSANNLTLPAILPTTLLGNSDFTIECWFYMTAAPSARSYCLITNYYNSTNGYSINVNSSRIITFNAAGDGYSITGTTVLPINSWHHMALCNTGGTSSKLYINGIQEGPTFTGTHRAGSLSQPFWIGQLYAGSYYSNFTGYISNFRVTKGTAVYTGNFTPPAAPPQPTQTPGLLGTNVNAIDGTNSSLLLLGSNAGIYDATAKNDIITVGNAQVSSTQIKYGTGAMYFDGTGDYLNIPNNQIVNFASGDYTVEAWVYPTVITGDQYVFSFGVPGGHWSINIYQSNWRVGYNLSIAGGSASAALNTWTHVAVTRSSGTQRFYLNGVLISSVADTNVITANGTVYVGAYFGSGNYWNGYIDDLRATKYARYTANFTPPTQGMIGQ